MNIAPSSKFKSNWDLHSKPSFFKTLGMLPGTWNVILLSVLAGFFEGIGIAMFIPLLDIIDPDKSEKTEMLEYVRAAFDYFNFSLSFEGLLIVVSLFLILGFIFIYIQKIFVNYYYNKYFMDLREKIFAAVLHTSWGYLSGLSNGEIINHLLVETKRAGDALFMQAIVVAVGIQAVVLGLFTVSLSLGMVVVVGVFGAALIIVSRPFTQKAHRLGTWATEANQGYAQCAVDLLRGAKLIKVTASENVAGTQAYQSSFNLYRAFLKTENNAALLNFVLQSTPVILLAAIFFLSYRLFGLSSTQILVFLLLIARIAPRLAEIQQRMEAYSRMVPGLVFIKHFLDECDRHVEPARQDKEPFTGFEHGIKVEGVSFSHVDTEKLALKNIDLEIPKNKMTAIVGSSGAGKSTLVNLLAGLYEPSQGRIFLDQTNLQDVESISWRKKIGYVSQDVVIFNDTIRNNLNFIHPEASEEELLAALETAYLEGVVNRLPDGLDTPLGEGGFRLSGGEKQRFALARALLGNPKLLILDEATSALDNESENIIQKAIQAISHTVTIVVVAHRLSTVHQSDMIVVMEGGEIVERGTYKDLLSADGRLRKLHDLQLM